MPIVDSGITTIGDDGAIKLSPQAMRLPPQINQNIPIPNAPGPFQGNINQVAPTPQSLGQTPETGPILQQKQGPGTLPTTSIPHEIYNQGVSEMPQRKDLEPHGIHKLGNILSSLVGGPFAPLVYKALQNVPYQRAERDWETNLAELRPSVQFEESQMREKGERERAEGTLAETKRAHEQQAENERLIEEHRLAQEKSNEELLEVERRRLEISEKSESERERADRARESKERQPNKDDKAIALWQKRASGQVLTPEENSYLKGYEKYVDVNKTQPGVERMGMLLQKSEYPVLDTANQNSPAYLSSADINEANRKQPGRYIPSGPGMQALKPEALLGDIRGNINQVRTAIDKLPEDFGKLDRAKIAFALRSNDPRGAINELISSGAISGLTPELQEYIISVTNLVENSLSMRQLLGVGQGSRDLRAAIEAVIPGPTTPSKSYAKKQLEYFEKTLGRLEAGIPKVPLRTDTGATGKPKGKVVSIEDDK